MTSRWTPGRLPLRRLRQHEGIAAWGCAMSRAESLPNHGNSQRRQSLPARIVFPIIGILAIAPHRAHGVPRPPHDVTGRRALEHFSTVREVFHVSW